MKFKNQLITACVVGLLLGGTMSAAKATEKPSWMPELPEILCVKNKVHIVWIGAKFRIIVDGIFCSMMEDLT